MTEQWTIYVCPIHDGPLCTHTTKLHEDFWIHTPVVPCERVCERIEVVPASRVEELEAALKELADEVLQVVPVDDGSGGWGSRGSLYHRAREARALLKEGER